MRVFGYIVLCSILLISCEGRKKVDVAKLKKEHLERKEVKLYDLDALGPKIEEIVRSNNPSDLADYIEATTLVRRGLWKYDVSAEIIDELTVPSTRYSIARTIVNIVSGANSFSYLGIRNKETDPLLLYRTVLFDGSINYLFFKIGKHHGKPVIIDVLPLSRGENISETFGRLFSMQSGNKHIVYGSDLDHMTRIVKKINHGYYRDAKHYYDFILPARFKNNFHFAMLGLEICKNLDDDVYEEQLIEMQSKWGDNDTLALVFSDLYFMQGRYDKALESIDIIDRLVGGDHYLNLFRANMSYEMGKYEEALDYIEKMRAREAFIVQLSLQCKFSVYVKTGRLVESIVILDQIVSEGYLSKSEINLWVLESFPEYYESEEYQKWYSTHGYVPTVRV